MNKKDAADVEKWVHASIDALVEAAEKGPINHSMVGFTSAVLSVCAIGRIVNPTTDGRIPLLAILVEREYPGELSGYLEKMLNTLVENKGTKH